MTITNRDPYDLRRAWRLTVPAANAPSSDDEGTSPTGGEDDTSSGEGTAPPPAGDDGSQDSTVSGDDGEGGDVDNPRIKQLSDEAARHRVAAKAEKDRADAAEATIRTLRLQLVFNAAAADAHITDLEAAWKLAQDALVAVKVAEDGTVDADRVAEIVAHAAKRYPYLAEPPADPVAPALSERFPALTSGRSLNSKRQSKPDTANYDQLAKKFRALRRGS